MLTSFNLDADMYHVFCVKKLLAVYVV